MCHWAIQIVEVAPAALARQIGIGRGGGDADGFCGSAVRVTQEMRDLLHDLGNNPVLLW